MIHAYIREFLRYYGFEKNKAAVERPEQIVIFLNLNFYYFFRILHPYLVHLNQFMLATVISVFLMYLSVQFVEYQVLL